MKIVYWLIGLPSLTVLLIAIVYCLQNRSGHSSVDPFVVLAFFGPVFLIGLTGRLITGRRWLSATFTEVVGFTGMIFPIFVTRLGILNQYDRWIAAGMPDRNPYGDLLLAGFVFGCLGGSLVCAYLITPKAQQGARHQDLPPSESETP